jgi:hypothetical protein
VRLATDGTPDTGFGQRGITCLDFGAFPFTLIGVQGNGAPLFGQLDGNIYRLLVDESASPGFLTPARSGVTQEVSENGPSATLSVVRTAGRDGVVSAHFNTRQAPADPRSSPPSTTHVAGADTDYRTTSGRLEWGDGDEGERSINVDIINDQDQEEREIFLVELDDVQGRTGLYGISQFIVGINDDDDDGAAQTGGSPSGGGGSITWYALALLGALAVRARAGTRSGQRDKRISKALRHARYAAPAAALATGVITPVALGGPGDLDPAFADVGRYYVPVEGAAVAWTIEPQDEGLLLSGGYFGAQPRPLFWLLPLLHTRFQHTHRG